MLKKSLRLTTRELETVLKTGRVLHSPTLSLRYVLNQKDIKYAVVAAQKIFKTSAKRHEIKRHVYDLIAPLVSKTKKGSWVAVFVKAPTQTKEKDKDFVSKEEIEEIFQKAGLIS